MNSPLATLITEHKDWVFNAYDYHGQIIGLVEDTNYLQLPEMTQYFSTPVDYFDWRFSIHRPTPMLNVYGKPCYNDEYLNFLFSVSAKTGLSLLNQRF
ncbi:hypothetical protein [Pediococcus inopinatus]|uniref:hypothetical protein n=1 Tax=Pediococcus inopinatus TaxID=114090 RepID=UPI00070B4FBA|nr:hypothetical protein [Pediococcus inopinatus]AVK99524.1 hypothetical protein PI20285_02025 [Pediococcus inopinatus]KRN63729.1 hypothetical protein IV83_GL000023 [Pediococcus inopinatus]